MTAYRIAHLEQIPERDDGRCRWRPVREHLGITSFGVTTWTARERGDRIINEHDEAGPGFEELYLVLEGHARFVVDGEDVDAPGGTFLTVAPEATRTAFAELPGTTVLALGGSPGRVYAPTGWEAWAPLRPLYESGRYAEAADAARALLADDPPYSELFYNTACCESLAGRREDALAHLRRAIELDPTARAFAAEDSDLDGLRGDPEFAALLES